MPAQTRHIDFLDRVRGVAIMAVFVFHSLGLTYYQEHLPWSGWHRGLPAAMSFLLFLPFTFGGAGVAIFFSVSGFCIHLSFRRRPDWREFWIRRVFRIYPPYLAALLFFALCFPTTAMLFQGAQNYLRLAIHLALVHNFSSWTVLDFNAAFWTIAIEIQLYLLYPVLLAVVSRLGWTATLYSVASIELILRAVSGVFFMDSHALNAATLEMPIVLWGNPLYYWFCWTMGAYLAEKYVRQETLPFGDLPLSLVTVAAVMSEMIKPLWVFSFPLFSLLTVIVIARMLRRPSVNEQRQGRFSRHLEKTGLWSYSIYLLHFPLLVWWSRFLRAHLPAGWDRGPLVLLSLLSAWAVIMPISGIWYRVFELPSIALGKRFTPRIAPGQEIVAP